MLVPKTPLGSRTNNALLNNILDVWRTVLYYIRIYVVRTFTHSANQLEQSKAKPTNPDIELQKENLDQCTR